MKSYNLVVGTIILKMPRKEELSALELILPGRWNTDGTIIKMFLSRMPWLIHLPIQTRRQTLPVMWIRELDSLFMEMREVEDKQNTARTVLVGQFLIHLLSS